MRGEAPRQQMQTPSLPCGPLLLGSITTSSPSRSGMAWTLFLSSSERELKFSSSYCCDATVTQGEILMRRWLAHRPGFVLFSACSRLALQFPGDLLRSLFSTTGKCFSKYFDFVKATVPGGHYLPQHAQPPQPSKAGKSLQRWAPASPGRWGTPFSRQPAQRQQLSSCSN